jgi:predicted nucleic acid-binding protein
MLVYVDTSVFGGAFDPEFEQASNAFFDRVRAGDFKLMVSPLVVNELEKAPSAVRRLLEELEPWVVRMDISETAYDLQFAYLEAGVLSRKWEADALHVAVATTSGCRAIISWNFRHIVNFRRIPLYNGVNRMQGCGPIAIHTPQEVIFDEED